MRKLALAFSFLICLFSFSPAEAQFLRRSVVEEFTGTWCGNCPRGIVGMERLEADFGDRFIGIAVHIGSSEPMLIPTYLEVQTDRIPGSGAPSCIIDRIKFRLDPYSGSGRNGTFHYGIGADFAAELDVPTEAKVELSAKWADEFQWDIRYTVTTTFNIDSKTAPYRLALVLTEDGMTGTTDSWRQTNYFSSEYSASAGVDYKDDDLSYWREAPYYVSGVVYNHVAVNTMGIRNGIEGSIKAPITAYEPQTFTYDLTTLASHTQRIIQDKSRLNAIAILLNTETGEVVNAAKAAVRPYGATDIIRGDVNGDGSVDVADISAIITFMANATVRSSSAPGAADVNGDGFVDVADISAVITIMADN